MAEAGCSTAHLLQHASLSTGRQHCIEGGCVHHSFHPIRTNGKLWAKQASKHVVWRVRSQRSKAISFILRPTSTLRPMSSNRMWSSVLPKMEPGSLWTEEGLVQSISNTDILV